MKGRHRDVGLTQKVRPMREVSLSHLGENHVNPFYGKKKKRTLWRRGASSSLTKGGGEAFRNRSVTDY